MKLCSICDALYNYDDLEQACITFGDGKVYERKFNICPTCAPDLMEWMKEEFAWQLKQKKTKLTD